MQLLALIADDGELGLVVAASEYSGQNASRVRQSERACPLKNMRRWCDEDRKVVDEALQLSVWAAMRW